MRQCFTFGFWLFHISYWSSVWMKRFAHKFDANISVCKLTCCPDNFFHCPKCEKYTVRKFASCK